MDANFASALHALGVADEERSLNRIATLRLLEEAMHVLEEKKQQEILQQVMEEKKKQESQNKQGERSRLIRKIGGGISYSKIFPVCKIGSGSSDTVADSASDDSADFSDRAVIPGSVLQELMELDADFPFLFQLLPEGEDILNPEHTTHISVAKFSREEVLYVPGEVMKRLGFVDSQGTALVENPKITLIYSKLQKATHATFQPLQRGFTDAVPNVIVFLEKWLQSKYAVISPGLVLPMVIRKPGVAPIKFDLLVESVKPELAAVSTIETDINISISETNATHGVKIPRLSDPSPHSGTRKLTVEEPNSLVSIPLELDKPVTSFLAANQAHFFKIQLEKQSPKSLLTIYLDIKSNAATPQGRGNPKGNDGGDSAQDSDADLYIGLYPIRFPTRTTHTYFSVDEIGSKKLEIKTSELQGQSIIFLSIDSGESGASYTVRAVYEDQKGEATAHGTSTPSASTTLCSNCKQHIPSANLYMHEAFCRRNVARCQHPGCDVLIRARDPDAHVHCSVCEKAVAKKALPKHNRIYHEPSQCGCGASLPLAEMRRHIEHDCPLRLIVCRFCHSEQEAGRGEISAEDITLGITSPHEASCGAHTIKCHVCNHKIVRKRFETHMKAMHPYHELPDHLQQNVGGSETGTQAPPRPILRRQGSSSKQLRPIRCPICAAEFDTEFQIHRHLDRDHNENLPQVGERTHAQDHTPSQPSRRMPGMGSEDLQQNPYPCMLCQSIFPTDEALQIHYDHEHP